MFDRTERRRARRIFYSRITLVVLAVAVLFFARGVWDIFEKTRETAEVKERHQQELAELNQRAGALREKLETLETERGVEAELRRKFDVAKEDERVIVLVEPNESESTESEQQGAGFWEQVKSFFGF